MAAAIDLEQHPLLWHPLPAAPVPRRTAGPDRLDRRLGEDPPQRPRGDDDLLALREQLGEVRPVHPVVRRRRELDEARPQDFVEPVDRRPAAVAVGETRLAVGRSGEEAADLAGREAEDGGGLPDRQAAVHDMLEHERSMLGPSVGRGRAVLGIHAPDGDKVAGRLARTESLAVDTRLVSPLMFALAGR